MSSRKERKIGRVASLSALQARRRREKKEWKTSRVARGSLHTGRDVIARPQPLGSSIRFRYDASRIVPRSYGILRNSPIRFIYFFFYEISSNNCFEETRARSIREKSLRDVTIGGMKRRMRGRERKTKKERWYNAFKKTRVRSQVDLGRLRHSCVFCIRCSID